MASSEERAGKPLKHLLENKSAPEFAQSLPTQHACLQGLGVAGAWHARALAESMSPEKSR